MTRKHGSELGIGDMVLVGIGNRAGRIREFLPHPQFAERNPGFTARVAITDHGSITIVDQIEMRIPD